MEKNRPVLHRGAHRCETNEDDVAGTRGTCRARGRTEVSGLPFHWRPLLKGGQFAEKKKR